jgi:hypothetical protein
MKISHSYKLFTVTTSLSAIEIFQGSEEFRTPKSLLKNAIPDKVFSNKTYPIIFAVRVVR